MFLCCFAAAVDDDDEEEDDDTVAAAVVAAVVVASGIPIPLAFFLSLSSRGDGEVLSFTTTASLGVVVAVIISPESKVAGTVVSPAAAVDEAAKVVSLGVAGVDDGAEPDDNDDDDFEDVELREDFLTGSGTTTSAPVFDHGLGSMDRGGLDLLAGVAGKGRDPRDTAAAEGVGADGGV
jgi:hypothetical protein